MAGGAPIPIPTADLDEKILSIKDLEKAASKKFAQSLKGNKLLFWCFFFKIGCCVVHMQIAGHIQRYLIVVESIKQIEEFLSSV